MFHFRLSYTVLFALMSAVFSPAMAAAELDDLERSIKSVSDAYYSGEFKSGLSGYQGLSIEDFRKTFNSFVQRGQYHDANILLERNKALFKRDISLGEVLGYVEHLIDHSTSSMSDELIDTVLDSHSARLAAPLHYFLAESYFAEDKFTLVAEHLNKITRNDYLSPSQNQRSLLMAGAIQQKQKQHRQAISTWEKIPEQSSYFPVAQLNVALSNIRLDWWTDAQLAIDRALANLKNDDSELMNRLWLVLGYSQFQNEFYRNARLSFRNVALDSQYKNRALLGLGLCALGQKDFGGAINAFSRLQQTTDSDLSTIESYLMLPYTLEKIGDDENALERYKLALTYFETQKREISTLKNRVTRSATLNLDSEAFLSVPEYMKFRYSELTEMLVRTSSREVSDRIVEVRGRLEAEIKELVYQDLDEKQQYIDSYVSQAQYGIAKLYDNK